MRNIKWRIASPGECLIEERRRKEGARDSGRKEKRKSDKKKISDTKYWRELPGRCMA